jgi:hypothetical protein
MVTVMPRTMATITSIFALASAKPAAVTATRCHGANYDFRANDSRTALIENLAKQAAAKLLRMRRRKSRSQRQDQDSNLPSRQTVPPTDSFVQGNVMAGASLLGERFYAQWQ